MGRYPLRMLFRSRVAALIPPASATRRAHAQKVFLTVLPLPFGGPAGAQGGALQQAAYSYMSEALALWLVNDSEGPAQLVPTPRQALLAAGLPARRQVGGAAGAQLAAVNLAAQIG